MDDAKDLARRASAMMGDVAEDATRMVRQLRKRVNPMDTTSLFMVFGVTVLALLLGMLVWNSATGRTRTHTDATGLKLTYPDNWSLSDSGLASGEAGTIVISRGIAGGRVPTRFEVQRFTVDASAPATRTLALVANDLTSTRARDLSNFKVLENVAYQGTGADKKPLQIKGLPGYKTRFVYVNTPNSPLSGNLPSVVLGDDWLVHKGDKVYVFSLFATEANHDEAMPQFESLVETAQLP